MKTGKLTLVDRCGGQDTICDAIRLAMASREAWVICIQLDTGVSGFYPVIEG